MSIESLAARAAHLKQQLNAASQNVANLSSQLQQATVNMHTISGHFSEVAYLLGEAQKEAGLIPEAALEQHVSCKEQEDGEADSESQESATKK